MDVKKWAETSAPEANVMKGNELGTPSGLNNAKNGIFGIAPGFEGALEPATATALPRARRGLGRSAIRVEVVEKATARVLALLNRHLGVRVGLCAAGQAVPENLDWVRIECRDLRFCIGSADRPFWQRMTRAIESLRSSCAPVLVTMGEAPRTADCLSWHGEEIEHKAWLLVEAEGVLPLPFGALSCLHERRWKVVLRASAQVSESVLMLVDPGVLLLNDQSQYRGKLVQFAPWEVRLCEAEEVMDVALSFEIGEFAIQSEDMALLSPGTTVRMAVPEELPAIALYQGLPLYRGTLRQREGQLEFRIEASIDDTPAP